MSDGHKQQPDPVEKSLGEQATGADVSRVDRELSLDDQSTSGDALSSMSDLVDDLGKAIDSDLPLIDLVARYEIEGKLGQGGMGAVLLATDRQLKRKVAIKRILGSLTQSKTALQRFVTEAQSIAALNHFNIVQVYEFGRDAEGPLLVLEYVEGGSLLDRLKDGKLEIEEAIDITCQLCDALGKAHGAGIIHRDIKPANILLTKRGEPKLTDFGLARQETADHGQTKVGVVLGTIDFMPPEQRRDATATDARSDLWSLAATLYQMLTGELPRVIDLADIPRQLRPVLSKALKSKPDDRYQTVHEFRDALKRSLTTTIEPLATVLRSIRSVRLKTIKPTFFMKWISHQGRVSRKEYWLSGLCLAACLFFSLGLINALIFESNNGLRRGEQLGICSFLMGMDLCLFAYFSICLTIKRLHDLNYSATKCWELLMSKGWKMPYEIFFAPAHQGANQYGEEPK